MRTITGLGELVAAEGDELGVTFDGLSISLNYGYEKIRFPAPVPVGSRVRMQCRLAKVKPSDGAVQATLRQTFEREGGDKPVCIAEHVVHLIV